MTAARSRSFGSVLASEGPPARGVRWAAAVGTGLLVCAQSATFVTHGFDVTDQGFLLTNQRRIVEGAASYEWSVTWLSDLVGGAWLRLGGDPGLLWARLGLVAVSGLIAAITCWILSRYFRVAWAAFAVLVATAVLRTNPPGTIDYLTVPVLFLLPAVALLARRPEDAADTPRAGRSLFAGTFVGFAVMAKISVIAFVVLPVVRMAIAWAFGQRPRRRDGVEAVALWGGVALAVGACLALLAWGGKLEEYASIFTGKASFGTGDAYSLKNLLVTYGHELWGAARIGLLLAGATAGLLAAIALFRRRRRSPRRVAALAGLALALVAAGLLLGPRQLGRWFDYRVAISTATVLGMLFVLAVERWVVEPSDRRTDLADLLGMGFWLAAGNAAGSATGLLTFKESAWLLLPTVLLCLPRSLHRLGRTSAPWRVRPSSVRIAFVCVGVVWVLASQALKAVSPYRDVRDPRARTASLAHPRLRHVRTTEGRARAVNDLFAELEKRVAPGDPVLAYGELCMVHYVTETDPSLGYAWPDDLHPRILEKRLAELGGVRPLPRAAVRSRSDMKSRAWGTEALPEPPDFGGQMKQIDDALARLGYVEAWSSRDFVILVRSR